MPRRIAGLVLAASLAAAVPAAADMLPGGRYAPSTHEFSIVLGSEADSAFHVAHEQASDQYVLVDFAFSAATHAMFVQRTIEWIKFGKPMDATPFDVAATDLVNSFLKDRYPDGDFAVGNRYKARTDSGQAYYVFDAKGSANRRSATWRGVVIFFPSGIAIVGETDTDNAQDLLAKSGVTQDEFVRWATTIRPER
jgi:hypothetical protein